MNIAGIAKSRFLYALVACYAVAAIWPAPGAWLLSLSPLPQEVFGQRQFLQIALAAAVFLASLSVGRQLQTRLSLRSVQLAAVAAVWKMALGLLMLTVIASVLPWVSSATPLAGLVVGLAVVVSMPTAVSAVAWTSHRRNDTAVALLATVTTTIMTPISVGLFFALVRVSGVGAPNGLEYQSAIGLLMACLIVPGAAGILVGRLLSRRCSLRFVGPVNSGLILALNYANASLVFPWIQSMHSFGPAILAVLLTLAVLCVLLPAARWICSAVSAAPRQAAAMRYAIGMSNTGLAIVILAGAGQANPWMLLTPAVFTLLQHVAAATLERASEPAITRLAAERPRETAAIYAGS
jgi:predicted Na+-dependent transporter